jgi:hypothetical protein
MDMEHIIRKVIKEELTKKDVRDIFKDEFDKMVKSNNLKDKVQDIVLKQLGSDQKSQKEIVKITQKVLVQLFKTFWVKRNFWSNNLENI